MFKYYVTLVLFSLSLSAARYQFPSTGIIVSSKTALYTDQKTGGFIPADRSFQFLAFEFDMAQPNNLSLRAFEETWKKAGQTVESKVNVFSNGFWGTDFKGSMTDAKGRKSYFRNYVIGDFLKVAQLGFVCAQKDPKEYCKGSDELIKSFQWTYKSEQRLLGLKSKIKVPSDYKLYMRVKTSKGPVFMYTRFGQPMSEDKVPTLTFAVNKGLVNPAKFLTEFAGNIGLTGIKIENSNITAKRTKSQFKYSWAKRSDSQSNFYISCGNLDAKKDFYLMVCATGDQSNYQSLHSSLSKLSSQ